MSKFWGDFGQAFLPAYGQSTQRTDRLAAVARAEAAQEAALKLAAEQRKDDLLWRKRQADIAQRRWELEQESKASALGLAAREKRGIIAGQLGEAGLPLGGGAPYVPTELESQMHSIAVANAKRKVKEEADKRMRSALDAAAAQGYTPPPEGVRAPGLTPQDVIARGSEAKLAADIAKEKRDAAKPELSTEDAVDGILQMRGQVGPQGQKVPQQSRQALLTMGRGPIMQLYGALKQQVAGIAQPTEGERDDTKLDEFAIEYDGASPERKAQIIRNAQTILSKRGDGKWTPEDVTKYLQSGQPPKDIEVPFEETAGEREQREKRLSMLKNMDDLLQTAEKQDWTGLIPGLKSEFFDKILPAGGLDKFANIKRLKFRSELGANAYAMARELLEESRMTDADFQHLRKYTPEEWMEKPEVLAKLRSLNELVRAKLMIQDKRAGKAPLFSLSPVEFFNQMDVPNEKFGGAVTVPSEIAPAVIRNSLSFRYINGNEKNPVTADYISGLVREGKVDKENATLWIGHLGLPYK